MNIIFPDTAGVSDFDKTFTIVTGDEGTDNCETSKTALYLAGGCEEDIPDCYLE